ncbi:hypothetical protein, partial [Actinomadura sp. B10D3]|uniref:hypothetical protein n=1 Tax=Actinomadura sp. B10D3 TaxID=3153557 RepID=UPI00325F31EC
ASKKSQTIQKMITGRSSPQAGPIKALAFNTLLSSQETDTHRAGSAFAFPAPGRLVLLYRILPGCQFPGFSDTPFRCRLRGTFRAVELFHQIRPDCQNEPFPTHHD